MDTNCVKLTLELYQVLARDFLLAHDRSALFAGLGLGKTASTLSALNTLFADGEITRALVVAPLRVANLTWPNEVKKWNETRWMRVASLRHKSPQDAEIHTINYESPHKLTSLDAYDVVVFDEITRAKNPSSKRINAFRKLLTTQRRWGLTGTPRPNSLLELFAQIRLLDDGQRFSTSFAHFRSCYFQPVDYMEYDWRPRQGSEEMIYSKIADLTLTLRSSDYLDIPDTVIEDVEVTMPEPAMKFYKTLEKDLLVLLGKNQDVVAVNAAVLVNKLLQVCGGSVYDESRGVVALHDAKIEALKKIVAGTEENVLVATNYIHERERVVAALEEFGAVDGAKFKGDIEDAWNSGRIRVLVADPRSLGHGLNLQKGGRTIVWFSPTWSREYYDQFNARLARKGQTEQPLVFRLICGGTMDDAVIESLREKGDGQNEMLRILTNYRLLKAA